MIKAIPIRTILVVAAWSVSALAAFPTNWSGWADVSALSDPVDTGLGGYRDIVELKHYQDSSFHYFQLGLRSDTGTTSATDYMVLVDSETGGGSYALTNGYVPQGLTGIDELVDAHIGAVSLFSNVSDTSGHDHEYQPGTGSFNLTIVGLDTVGADAQGGESFIDWQVPAGLLPSGRFDVYGATHTVGGSTHDITGAVSVPEPSGLLVLTLAGAAALIRRRRR